MLAVRLDLVPELEDVHHDDVVGGIAVRLGPDGLIDMPWRTISGATWRALT